MRPSSPAQEINQYVYRVLGEGADRERHVLEGVCEDGAAILCDGQQMTVGEILDALEPYRCLTAGRNGLRDALVKVRLL
jgi:hypothetical protein